MTNKKRGRARREVGQGAARSGAGAAGSGAGTECACVFLRYGLPHSIHFAARHRGGFYSMLGQDLAFPLRMFIFAAPLQPRAYRCSEEGEAAA